MPEGSRGDRKAPGIKPKSTFRQQLKHDAGGRSSTHNNEGFSFLHPSSARIHKNIIIPCAAATATHAAAATAIKLFPFHAITAATITPGMAVQIDDVACKASGKVMAPSTA
jgi:hypothetical protein